MASHATSETSSGLVRQHLVHALLKLEDASRERLPTSSRLPAWRRARDPRGIRGLHTRSIESFEHRKGTISGGPHGTRLYPFGMFAVHGFCKHLILSCSHSAPFVRRPGWARVWNEGAVIDIKGERLLCLLFTRYISSESSRQVIVISPREIATRGTTCRQRPGSYQRSKEISSIMVFGIHHSKHGRFDPLWE